MSFLIDTHIWIWWLTGQKDLPQNNRDRLDSLAKKGTPPCIAAISLWEAQMLARKGRLALNIDFPEWLLMASDPGVVQILPINASVVIALDALSRRFHGDPADRMIVATAIAHQLPLMTADKSIRRSRIVEMA
ncbi:MAG: type II toxin-antitoxin system VapC family toxin [Verrucomicrobiota bacterium]